MKKVKLSKSQLDVMNLYQIKANKAKQTILNYIDEATGEVLNFKLMEFATELGINLTEEDWRFESQTNEFIQVPKTVQPEMTTVKKKEKK